MAEITTGATPNKTNSSEKGHKPQKMGYILLAIIIAIFVGAIVYLKFIKPDTPNKITNQCSSLEQ